MANAIAHSRHGNKNFIRAGYPALSRSMCTAIIINQSGWSFMRLDRHEQKYPALLMLGASPQELRWRTACGKRLTAAAQCRDVDYA